MIQLTQRLERAIRTAAYAHRHQVRKAGATPYIIHPFSVMLLASEDTDDEDVLIACLFHDIFEDVPDEYTENDMRTEFGDRVAQAVLDVSKDDKIKDWRERSEAYLEHLQSKASDEAILVSLADKTHNLLSTLSDFETHGDDVWQRFNADKYAQLWWYSSVQQITKQRRPELSLHNKLATYIEELQNIVENK
ncbi:MAG: HD domain-containing protein [Actinobacteria bacterium]|nr:HD domain-containing protein [Actinomycetota bacterium]